MPRNKLKEIRDAEIVNLTPHSVILLEQGVFLYKGAKPRIKVEFPACKEPARCKHRSKVIDAIMFKGIPIEITSTDYYQVDNLPAPKEGVFYIVSKLVADVMLSSGREDLLVLSSLIREGDKIIGGRSLAKFTRRP